VYQCAVTVSAITGTPGTWEHTSRSWR